MVSLFIFSAPLLVIRGSPPGIRSGQRKRRGRSNSSSTRQTVSALPIRPSPLTRGQPPSPSGPSRLLGAKSHKTSFHRAGLARSGGGIVTLPREEGGFSSGRDDLAPRAHCRGAETRCD